MGFLAGATKTMNWVMRATHTHLYPGARLLYRGTDETDPRELEPGDALLIEFADLSTTLADVMAADGVRVRIKVEGYRTRRGAQIETKIWMIQRVDSVRDSFCYRVTGQPIREPSSRGTGL